MKFLYTMALLLLVISCRAQKPTVTAQYGSVPDSVLAQWYAYSIDDALNPEPSEIIDTLWGINPSTQKLEYQTMNGDVYVRAANLLSDWSYTNYYGDSAAVNNGSYTFQGSYRLWVSLVPQAQLACTQPGYAGDYPLRLRLQMAFGLPPVPIKEAGDELVVMELWVRVVDLQRPAADPDPHSNTTSLDLPTAVSPVYRSWFNYTRAYQYGTKKDPVGTGYPWTQLGYTYDWSPSNPSHVGMSEYVLQPGAHVYLIGKTAIAQYCTPK